MLGKDSGQVPNFQSVTFETQDTATAETETERVRWDAKSGAHHTSLSDIILYNFPSNLSDSILMEFKSYITLCIIHLVKKISQLRYIYTPKKTNNYKAPREILFIVTLLEWNL